MNGLHLSLDYTKKVTFFCLVPILYLWLHKEMDISAIVSYVETEAFVSRALTDHTYKSLLCPTRISPDVSVQRPGSII